MICPHCETFFDDFIGHLVRCEVNLDRLVIIGLLTTKEKEFITEQRAIVTTHKSNLMPIRKDNKTAAVEAAQMRR